jgi:transcriptional regulator with XRE-family HTH domain
MDTLSLNEKFQLMRKRRKITKVLLADLSGINRNTIAGIEEGDVLSATLGTLMTIAKALQCEVIVDLKPFEDFRDGTTARERAVVKSNFPKPLRATHSFGGSRTGTWDIRFGDDSFIGVAYREDIARLFAAAPDLYEACVNILNACLAADIDGELDSRVSGDLMDAASTAIAKAEAKLT